MIREHWSVVRRRLFETFMELIWLGAGGSVTLENIMWFGE